MFFFRRSSNAEPYQRHPHHPGSEHQDRSGHHPGRPDCPAAVEPDRQQWQDDRLPRQDLRRRAGQQRCVPHERSVHRHRAEQPVQRRHLHAAGGFRAPGSYLPGSQGCEDLGAGRDQGLIRRPVTDTLGDPPTHRPPSET